VSDLQETPATPPEPSGGDERIGYLLAGGVLIALGWVFGVVVNVLLHWAARTSPATVWGVHIGPNFGEYAWAVFGLGLVTGAMGVVLLGVGRSTPSGPFVLPGVDY
jgi:hypothetical protein